MRCICRSGLFPWVKSVPCCQARVRRQRPLELALGSAQLSKPAAPERGWGRGTDLQTTHHCPPGPLPTSLSSSPGSALKRWPVWFLERAAFFRYSSLPAENLCAQLTEGRCLQDAGLIWNGSFRSESFPRMTLLLPRWYWYQYLSNVTFSDCGSYIFIVENFENFNIISSPLFF